MAELLIFVRSTSPLDFDGVDVVHRFSSRLFVVDEEALTAAPFTNDPIDFSALSSEANFTDELQQNMSSEEQMFTQSWFVKSLKQGHNRRADGADWDSPGFEVPDATHNNDVPD